MDHIILFSDGLESAQVVEQSSAFIYYLATPTAICHIIDIL